ncbi:hypothetical protein MASR2M48_25130 [Spirochaetota bacterium]
MVESCKAYEHFLRGASLVAHDTETPELALSYAKLERSRAESAYLYTLSPEAKAHLSVYFRLARRLGLHPYIVYA